MIFFSDSSFLFRFRINNQPPLTTTSKCLGANKPTKSNKIKKQKLHQHLRMTRLFGGQKVCFKKQILRVLGRPKARSTSIIQLTHLSRVAGGLETSTQLFSFLGEKSVFPTLPGWRCFWWSLAKPWGKFIRAPKDFPSNKTLAAVLRP